MMNLLVKNYKKIYFFSLFGGIVFLFVARQLSNYISNGQNIWLQSSAFVIAWMLFLLSILWKKSEDDYEESDADYYYYLGFILTISTLAISFVPEVVFSQTTKVISNRDLLTSFGVGLITTIIGLIGRIVLYLKYERHITGAEDAVQRMSIVGDRFAKELATLTSSMRSNLEVISHSYDSSASDLISSTGKLSNQINLLAEEIQKLRIAAGAAAIDIGVATNKFEESLLVSTKSTQSTADIFSDAGKVFSSSVDEFALKLAETMPFASFKDDLSRVQVSLLEFVGSLKSSNEYANSLANNLNRLSEVIDISGAGIGSRLSALSDSLVAETVGFQNHSGNLKEFAESISRQSAKISEFEIKIGSLCENLNGLDKNFDQARRIFSGISELETNFNSLNTQFSAFSSMQLPLKAVSTELEKVATQLGGMNTDWSLKASRLFDDAIQSQKEFIENLKTSQDALNETHTSLIDAIKSIKSQFQ
jgi:hypothetical protein